MANILHITDFHYKSKTFDRFSQDKIIEKLCKHLALRKNQIDLIVFTGDLVQSGTELNDFTEANDSLIKTWTGTINHEQGIGWIFFKTVLIDACMLAFQQPEGPH